MYYIGIDIAKKRHEVCFLDESGNVLDGNSFQIPNTASGLDKLQNYLDKMVSLLSTLSLAWKPPVTIG